MLVLIRESAAQCQECNRHGPWTDTIARVSREWPKAGKSGLFVGIVAVISFVLVIAVLRSEAHVPSKRGPSIQKLTAWTTGISGRF